jgi:predicted nucleic acid-binding Zn ribbon protein
MARRRGRRGPKPAAWAIENLVRDHGWQARLNAMRVVVRWEQVVGEGIAPHARAVRCEEGTLLVATDSPAWSHTLTMMKRELLKRLVAVAPSVKDIRFVQADGSVPPPRLARRRSRRGYSQL